MGCRITSHGMGLSIRRAAISFTCLLVCVAIGCGPSPPKDADRTTVSGTVTFAGKPLPAGDLTFESIATQKATPAAIKQGKYSTDRVPLGECRVSISTMSVQYLDASSYVAIPAKYGDSATSGLKIDVKEGVNENVNFELTP
jgi:hypothetical protein